MNASVCTLVASLLVAQAPVAMPTGGCSSCQQAQTMAQPYEGYHSAAVPFRPHRPIRNLFHRMWDGLVEILDPAVPVPGYGCCQYGTSGVWQVPGPLVSGEMVPVPIPVPGQATQMQTQSVITITEPPLAGQGTQPVSTPAPRVIEQTSFGPVR